MVCGDNYFSIQFNILHLAILLALVQTGEGDGDLDISEVMVTQSDNFGTSGRRSSRSEFGQSTGNDVSGH